MSGPEAPRTAEQAGRIPFSPADETQSSATVFRCGLCGFRFTHGGIACGGCPLHAGCELVRCPNCGFQFPRGSRVIDGIRRLMGAIRRRERR